MIYPANCMFWKRNCTNRCVSACTLWSRRHLQFGFNPPNIQSLGAPSQFWRPLNEFHQPWWMLGARRDSWHNEKNVFWKGTFVQQMMVQQMTPTEPQKYGTEKYRIAEEMRHAYSKSVCLDRFLWPGNVISPSPLSRNSNKLSKSWYSSSSGHHRWRRAARVSFSETNFSPHGLEPATSCPYQHQIRQEWCVFDCGKANISADPCHSQGRGGAWGHRRCGNPFLPRQWPSHCPSKSFAVATARSDLPFGRWPVQKPRLLPSLAVTLSGDMACQSNSSCGEITRTLATAQLQQQREEQQTQTATTQPHPQPR